MKPICMSAWRRSAAAFFAVGLFSAPAVAQEAPTLPPPPAHSDIAGEPAARRTFHFDDVALPRRYGKADEWWLTASAGASFDVREDSRSYSMHLAGSYFLVDDFSLDIQGSLFFIDQEFENVVAGSGALIFRKHWRLGEGDATFFLDGGAGILGASDDIPADGAEFGFTPQLGVGLTFPIGNDNTRLMLGVKWHHISTGRLNGADNNEGRDAAMFYAGLTFPL
jgi:hypothetical protein